jgi:hypothetical protein
LIKFTILDKLAKVWNRLRLKLPREVINACAAGMRGFPGKRVDHGYVPSAGQLTGMYPKRRAEGKRRLKETSGNRWLLKDYRPEVLKRD